MHENQSPTLDTREKADVFWVGISSKKNLKVPLDKTTRSGKLINEIEKLVPNAKFYSTNLVKCAPIDGKGKLRYPKKDEIEACKKNFDTELEELGPSIVFLLGNLVASKIFKSLGTEMVEIDKEFNYKSFEQEGITYVPVHHPSYISRFKRNKIEEYKKAIAGLIKKILKLQEKGE